MNIDSTIVNAYPQYSGNSYAQGTDINSSSSPTDKSGQGAVSAPRIPESNSKIRTNEDPNKSTDSPQSGLEETQLTREELRLVEQLQQIDSEVRIHEMAHMAAGGAYITSGATFSYQQGPDGKKYAVGGEVGIDTSPVPGDPQATLRKMRQVRSAALAPASPSSQDLKVAANAASLSTKALSEITMLQAKKQSEQNDTQAFGNTPRGASDAYIRVNTLPEDDTSTFKIAV